MLLHPGPCESNGSNYAHHRARPRPFLSRTCSSRNSLTSTNKGKKGLLKDDVSIPPSMRSVMLQMGQATLSNRKKKRLLDDPLQSGNSDINVPFGIPRIYDLQDLDMETVFEPDEIKPAPPLYERPKRNLRIQNNLEEICELESWPDPSPTLSASLVVPDRRPRQPGLNPNFLKLYAIETTCRIQQILPCVNIDESLLRQLSYHDLHQINISTPHASREEIKLALETRKKLWTEMIAPQRQDLYGESLPRNQKFILVCDPQHGRQGSLVRIDSDVKPWTFQGGSTMLRPCGTLKVGARKPDIQYVVKGWCDSRFS